MAYGKPKKTLSKAEEENLASNNWERYTRARDAGHDDYMEIAQQCDQYYRGQQWEAADVATLDDQGRPALTINTILPTINTVLGEQSTRRADIKFKPRGSGMQEVADVLTKVYMQVADNNKLDWTEAQVFADGLIQDRGWFDVRVDFSDNYKGEVRITAKDPLDIIIDPDAKDYDPRHWNEIFETKWMSLDEIEEQYSQKAADKLRLISEMGTSYGGDSMEYQEQRYGDTEEHEYSSNYAYNPEEARIVRAIRVIERQYYQLRLHVLR